MTAAPVLAEAVPIAVGDEPLETVAPYDQLQAAEFQVADTGAELLDLRKSRQERAEFSEAMKTYKEALSGNALEVFESLLEGGADEITAKRGLIQFLLASKQDVVSDASFHRAEESMFDRGLESLNKTRRRRLVGRIAMAGVIGGGVYALSRGVDWGVYAAGTTYVAAKAGVAAKAVTGFLGKQAREGSQKRLDRYAAKRMEGIYEQIASISDPREREAVKHDLLMEAHIRGAEKELSVHAMTHSLAEDERPRQEFVKEMVDIVEESIYGTFGVAPHSSGRAAVVKAVLTAAKGLLNLQRTPLNEVGDEVIWVTDNAIRSQKPRHAA